MFPYDPSRLLLTEELDGWRRELDYRGPVPKTWAGRLRRDLEAEAVAASTSMEGVPVTVEQVHYASSPAIGAREPAGSEPAPHTSSTAAQGS